MAPFFGATAATAAALFLVLSLLDTTAGQQSVQPGNFQNNRDNRPNLFNNNIDPF